ncbi:PLP-dependent cysteine synthase family protein [Gilliamella sp. CG13]|uniref:PLP-dependent cysteine synthase family protein n=1 Tax=Gilliamella sp. CG13 TaxID=3351502 RepID=UPI00398820B3
MIYSSILDIIGNTPIVYLSKLSKFLGANIFAKLENLNPGGSHKVRIALGMIIDAEKKGILKRGSGQTIIEPSGGNTGIGLAMAANLFGYKLILVIPDNYSKEKQKLLKLYGADIVLSDSKLGNNSHGEKALELQLQNPQYVMLNQQKNSANPQAHRETTALEIVNDFSEMKLDFFIGGIGTGGHITGIGEVIKQKWSDLKVIGVEPEGCDLINDIHAAHKIQGLSVGIIPSILNTDLLDDMISVDLDECKDMCKFLLKTESISIGISSAANFVAIKKLLEKKKKNKNCNILTLVYDNLDSYLDYFNN